MSANCAFFTVHDGEFQEISVLHSHYICSSYMLNLLQGEVIVHYRDGCGINGCFMYD
jgi:hypothetical protein